MKLKNFQLLLLLIYSIIVLSIFYFIFFEIGIVNISDLNYIKDKALNFENIFSEKILLLKLIFFVISIFYVFCLGIYFPLVVVFGFFFNPIQGTILVNLSSSIGSLFLYMFANKFFEDLSYFKKFENIWLKKFRKNEFLFIFLFRLFGGGGIPSNLQNLIPVIFRVKKINYFLGTFFGQLPGMFVVCNLVHQLKSSIISEDSFFHILFNDQKLLVAFILYLSLVILLFVFGYKLKKL